MLREESCVRGQESSAQGAEGSLPRNKNRGYQVRGVCGGGGKGRDWKLLFRRDKVAIQDDLKQNSARW